MSQDVEFGAPPPARGGLLRDWGRVADQLRARPGEWAIVDRGTKHRIYTYAVHVRKGGLAPFRPAGSFEAVGRLIDGERVLYARYVGNGDAP